MSFASGRGLTTMKLIVQQFLTLDGVVQGPGVPDEDRSGGFDHGGWSVPYADDVFGQTVEDSIAAADGLLLGRKTYEIFAAYWPRVTDPDNRVAAMLNRMPKHVASRTLDTVEWNNSTLIKGDVAEGVARLKADPGRELQVHGSADLAQTLMRHDLVDEIVAHERLREVSTAVHLELPPGVGLQPGDPLGDVALDERRVVPLDRVERPRRDVFRHPIQHRGDPVVGVGDAGPVRGEDLVRLAPEQEPVRGGDRVFHCLSEHVVGVRDRPPAVVEPAAAVLVGHARALHDAIECEELLHDQLHGCETTSRRKTHRSRLKSPTITARSASVQVTRPRNPACSSQATWSGIGLGLSYSPSMGAMTSAGFSGTTTSPMTSRPPAVKATATRRKRSALPGPSRWCTASAEITRSKGPSGSSSSSRAIRKSPPGTSRRACSSISSLSSMPINRASG